MCDTCKATCGCPAAKPFDPTKPVQLRNGIPARIICTDQKGDKPIVILYTQGQNENVGHRYADGRLGTNTSARDLVNVPDVRVEYRNIWGEDGAGTFSYKTYVEAASKCPSSGIKRLGIQKLIFTDDKLTSVELVTE
jgi:hypothetical protein